MNAEQKRAWLGVVTTITCVVGYFVLLPFLGSGAAGVFGFLGINGFGTFIGRGEKADERDKNIARRATLGGAVASYFAFFTGCMGTWFVVFLCQHKEQVPVHMINFPTMWSCTSNTTDTCTVHVSWTRVRRC